MASEPADTVALRRLPPEGGKESRGSPSFPPEEDTARRGVVRVLHDGHAVIGLAGGACSGCGKKSGCTVGRLADGMKETRIELPAPDGLRVGDTVTLEIDAGQLVGNALLGYLLPACGLLLGAGFGNAAGGDAAAVAGAGLGLLLGLLVARLLHRRRGRDLDVRISIG